jgi:VanZ family protein
MAALGCITFFILIIRIANRGEGDRWWSFIHLIPHGDKVGHLGLVGALSFICNLASARWKWNSLPRWITPATLILLLLLTGEEIAQAYQPHRTCDIFDWFADLAGLAAGQWLSVLVARWRGI